MRGEMTKYVTGRLKVKENFLIEVVIQNFTTGYSERVQWLSGRLKTEGSQVGVSPASLIVVLEQDTFILA